MGVTTSGTGSYVLIQRNNFQGNGNCDETREANRRAARSAARVTGMESEIAPYYGPVSAAGVVDTTGTAGASDTAGTAAAIAAAEGRSVGSSTAERQMAAAEAAENRAATNAAVGGMVPQGVVRNDAINDGYGTEYEHTAQEEEGMSSFPQDSFTEPLTASEAARNSWRALLARNVGRTVLVRFLVGTQNITTVEGELYEVGTDYIVIYQPLWDSHITADLYMVKFVEFREPTGVMTLD